MRQNEQWLAGVLTKAKKQYENGNWSKAAETLGDARARASRLDDPESVKVIDEWISQLGGPLQGSDRQAFDSEVAESTKVVDVSPAGLVIAGIGAIALIISVFLPYADSSSSGFAIIEKNTLIQNGAGWAFVILALIGAVRIYAAYRSKTRTWAPIWTGGLAIAYAIYFGSNGGDSLKLCSVATGTNCQVASPGTGVYLAGVGGLLMVVGGLLILGSKKVSPPGPVLTGVLGDVAPVDAPPPSKVCPDCAETILAAARVCKHCGYRFDEMPTPVESAPMVPPAALEDEPITPPETETTATTVLPSTAVTQVSARAPGRLSATYCTTCGHHPPAGATSCPTCGGELRLAGT